MSELFEYKPTTDNSDAVKKALDELEAETSVSKEQANNELEEFGGTLSQVNEDYEDTSEVKNTEPELTQDDIDNIFGEDWDGSFIDMTGIVENYAQDMASQMQYFSSFGEYLSINKDNIIDDISRRTGIATVKISIEQIKNNFECLSSGITNFKTFGFTNGSTDMLYNSDRALDNIEEIINNSIQLQDKAEDIIDYIENSPHMIDNIGNYIDEKLSDMTEIFSSTNVSNLLNTFPQSVIDKFSDIDIVQNYYTMQSRLYSSIENIMLSLTSIEAPSSLSSTLTTIKQLKSLVSQLRDVRTQIQQGARLIEGVRNNIANGNYIGVLLNAKDVSKFIEKAPSYAAKYPYNLAYETEGGHIFEVDNTPNKERLHIKHSSGTDVELSPVGDMVAKVKKDFQTIVESNFETHVKGNQNIVVDKNIEVDAKGINITSSESTNLSASDSSINIDTLSIMSKLFSVLSSSNLTLSSNLETSVSSGGMLYLTSKKGIVINAPVITIGTPSVSLIGLNGSIVTENSDYHYINSGRIKENGGLISLN